MQISPVSLNRPVVSFKGQTPAEETALLEKAFGPGNTDNLSIGKEIIKHSVGGVMTTINSPNDKPSGEEMDRLLALLSVVSGMFGEDNATEEVGAIGRRVALELLA